MRLALSLFALTKLHPGFIQGESYRDLLEHFLCQTDFLWAKFVQPELVDTNEPHEEYEQGPFSTHKTCDPTGAIIATIAEDSSHMICGVEDYEEGPFSTHKTCDPTGAIIATIAEDSSHMICGVEDYEEGPFSTHKTCDPTGAIIATIAEDSSHMICGVEDYEEGPFSTHKTCILQEQ
ncbi:hypothetical protein J6590_032255 [Homalodisca vitripennis]|nr:hypothetical protein J6590_032255 [Homalodisca vitripennis]